MVTVGSCRFKQGVGGLGGWVLILWVCSGAVVVVQWLRQCYGYDNGSGVVMKVEN